MPQNWFDKEIKQNEAEISKMETETSESEALKLKSEKSQTTITTKTIGNIFQTFNK